MINFALDLVVLLPMSKLTFKDWFFQIGIRYFIIPITSIAIGKILEMKTQKV
jgi:hypothetical protein